MSITFSEFLLYLLPGFLGLLVFKRVVQEDIDRRSETTQIALGLLFGVTAFCLLYSFDLKFSSFFTFYITLCGLSLGLGCACSLLNVIGLSIPRLLAKLMTVILRIPEKTSNETALRAMVNSVIHDCKCNQLLARVYSVNTGSNNAIIGWLTDYSDTSQEIALTRLEFCSALPGLNQKLDIQPRRCCVNYYSGMVIEIFDWDKEKAQKFITDASNLYEIFVSSK